MSRLTWEEFKEEFLDCAKRGGTFYPDGVDFNVNFSYEYCEMVAWAEEIVESNEDPEFADITDFDEAFEWIFKSVYKGLCESAASAYDRYCEEYFCEDED